MTESVVSRLRQTNERIVITGAGGWLGMATLELLHMALGDAAFDARVVCFGSRKRTLQLRNGKMIVQHPLAELMSLPVCNSWVLHFAFLTKDKAQDMNEADYATANRELSLFVRNALDHIGVQGVFVASSGAAYAQEDDTAEPALRLYGASKVIDEEMFLGWALDRGKASIIARIFNLSGPYISLNKPYAMLDFIRSALNSTPIVIRATQRVERSYVAVRELMSLVFALLIKGDGTCRFDTGGDAIELADLARIIAEMMTHVAVERAEITNADVNRYVGNRSEYDTLCREFEIESVGLREQIRETQAYLSALV